MLLHPLPRRFRSRVTLGLVALALVAAGCSSSDQPDDKAATGAGRDTSGPTVLQPGRPGEAAETLGPDATVEQPKWNDVDAAFLQMMIPHHGQALQMSELARTRAADPQVKALAERIAAAQGPEIHAMSAWLRDRDLEVPSPDAPMSHGAGGHGGHGDHGNVMPMQGMLSAAEMKRLAAARGAEFDRLFLAGMIRHHQGAIDMAGRALVEGSDLRVNEIAAEVAAGQTAEIDRMRDLQQQ